MKIAITIILCSCVVALTSAAGYGYGGGNYGGNSGYGGYGGYSSYGKGYGGYSGYGKGYGQGYGGSAVYQAYPYPLPEFPVPVSGSIGDGRGGLGGFDGGGGGGIFGFGGGGGGGGFGGGGGGVGLGGGGGLGCYDCYVNNLIWWIIGAAALFTLLFTPITEVTLDQNNQNGNNGQ
ncbi:SCTR [Mytilus edulis]|uniref:SCTR n=1 Tax=Mytilus edulis TaxID=6550 RepID=A0A8S3RAD8_MYTED|nr:SCTR [Mytilus edulis]